MEFIKKKRKCRDLSNVKEFLHIYVSRKGSKIYLDQCAYLETVLQQCGIENIKTAQTLLPTRYCPKPNTSEASPILYSGFQAVIESLLYLVLET